MLPFVRIICSRNGKNMEKYKTCYQKLFRTNLTVVSNIIYNDPGFFPNNMYDCHEQCTGVRELNAISLRDCHVILFGFNGTHNLVVASKLINMHKQG